MTEPMQVCPRCKGSKIDPQHEHSWLVSTVLVSALDPCHDCDGTGSLPVRLTEDSQRIFDAGLTRLAPIEEAEAHFAAYLFRNYPDGVTIARIAWHVPEIVSAAEYAYRRLPAAASPGEPT